MTNNRLFSERKDSRRNYSRPAGLALIIAALISIFMGLATESIWAHAGTGTPQFSNEVMGPYRIYVWSDPEPPIVGEYHVAVALTENLEDDPTGFAGTAVLDADVTVTLRHQESDLVLSAPATHEDSVNKVFYEAILELPEMGLWQTTVQVEDEEGPHMVSYQTMVEPARFPWTTLAAGIGSVLLIGAALWLQRRTHQGANQLETQGI